MRNGIDRSRSAGRSRGRTLRCLLAALAVAGPLFGAAGPSRAAGAGDGGDPAPSEPRTPPPAYEGQLLHLARLLGSVDYLRQLCNKGAGTDWRQEMQALIDTEAKGEDLRIRQLTAAFNRGYRSFASVYVTCTDSAIEAEKQYRREGATLAREIAAKYGN